MEENFIMDESFQSLPCPHCGIPIQIEQVNCAIFRCGIYKKKLSTNKPSYA